jgi:hypothetical protein
MAEGPEALHVELVDVDVLNVDDRNANRGDVPSIMASLKELGQHRPLVVQRGTNKVIAGNHTLIAARTLGWDQVNVLWVDDDDRTAIRRALADNATARKGTWDEDVLKELLTELGGSEAAIPGLGDREVDRLLADVDGQRKAAPALPIVARMGEEYDYVVVVAKSDLDSRWLHTRFALRREASYKNQKIGTSRVVTVERLRQEWGEIPGPDDAPETPTPEPSRTEPEQT